MHRAARRPPGPRIFQIGMNRAGTHEICAHFAARGFSYAHWHRGKLAREILAAKERGVRPLTGTYDRIHLISDMAVNGRALCYDGALDVGFLAEHFPEAVFLLNHRPVEEWVASRSTFRGGEYLEEQRVYFGLRSPDDVAAKWRADWSAQVETVARLKRNGLKVIEWPINTEKPHLFFERLEALLSPV